MRPTDTQLAALFIDLMGADSVVLYDRLDRDLAQRIVHSLTDDSFQPACILYPKSIAELSEAIALAYKYRLRILPFGRATKLDWGGLVTRADVAISTSRLNRIIEHCVGDLTVTVESGVKYRDLQISLAKAGQFLAIDPPYSSNATIGGILATGSTGSLRHRYRSVRDMCLGIEFVRSDGELVKAGGRVVKNVAGYDLMKLLTGSYGTLGVVANVTFRLYPLPEYTQVIVLTGSASAIAQAQQQISTSVLTPTVCDLLSTSAIANLGLEVKFKGNIGLLLQFASLKASVIEQCDRITKLAQELNLQVQIITEFQEFWQLLELLMWQEDLHNQPESSTNNHFVCKLGLLPSAALSTIQQCEHIFNNQSHYLQIHLGSGLGLLRVENDRNNQDLAAIAEQITKVRLVTESHGGFLTILEAPHELKFKQNVWGYTGNASDLMHKIQTQFDPRGLFSPDRLF